MIDELTDKRLRVNNVLNADLKDWVQYNLPDFVSFNLVGEQLHGAATRSTFSDNTLWVCFLVFLQAELKANTELSVTRWVTKNSALNALSGPSGRPVSPLSLT